ncbi:MAG TPA: HAMP domain-containing sensor histidine kinase [Acidimicrobiales bacterium]|nr:HAMP domain-containing sensor histidine kinase [Acidimicrobiales bacterium]
MRRRISLTMAALVVGVLVLVGLATLGLTQLDSIHQTQEQLTSETQGLANGVEAELSSGRHHDLLEVLRSTVSVLKGPLEQQGEVLAVSRTGTTSVRFYDPLNPSQRVGLPSGLTPQEILTEDFFLGSQPVSGHRGRLVWAAELLPTPVPVGPGTSLNVVVVLTREAPTGLGAAGYWFSIAAAATLVVALLAAYRLGRRLTRPLQLTEVVTRRIAAGDLDARVHLQKKEGHELVSLANSVNQMAASLARAQRAQRQFLMSVSHDLRTPLTAVRGFAEALADGKTSDVRYATGVILSEARRLERLVADLLELAKLEAGAFSLHCVPVNLSEVASDAVQAFEQEAERLGLALEVGPAGPDGSRVPEGPEGPGAPGAAAEGSEGSEGSGARAGSAGPATGRSPGSEASGATAGSAGPEAAPVPALESSVMCDADPDRLAQAVCNMVENALKYASSRVAVTTRMSEGLPTLLVEDDGPGIATEDLDRVFERLYQSASAASRKLGSGLGLAIVEELVNAMGGRVRAESPITEAGGTRLVVVLRPAGRSPAGDRAVGEGVDGSGGGAGPQARGRGGDGQPALVAAQAGGAGLEGVAGGGGGPGVERVVVQAAVEAAVQVPGATDRAEAPN